MAEEETNDEKAEEPKPDVEEGNKGPSAIEVAEKLHAQIKVENDRHEQLIERQEKIAAQNMLGGSSDAGQEPPKKEKMTDEEYKNKVLTGEIPKKDE